MTSIAFVNERMLRGFGVDLVIDEVAAELGRRGHDVTVYASVADIGGARPYRLRTIPTRASGVPQRYERAAKAWASYIDAYEHDVVFVESYPFFSLVPRLKTPTVVVDHGVSSTDGMALKQRAAFRYIERVQQRRYFPKAAGIVTVSEYIRSLLPKNLQERTKVIYNGGDHYASVSSVERATMRARLGIADGDVMMLYVGRLNPEGQPYKGTASLIDAAARWRNEAPNIRLVMAGRGSNDDAARIREAGGVPLLDVPEEEMGSLYAAADVYLTASRWEGFDLPLVEAAHQGVPAVALRVGAHPEVVRDGETGILAEDEAGLLAEAQHLAGDPARRRALGEAARAWAQRFTWAGATAGYEEVIREVVGAHTPARATASVASGSRSSAVATSASDAAAATPPATDVTAIILNYGADYETLRQLMASVVTQTYPVHTLLVDNGSPRNRDAVEAIKREFPDTELLMLDRNFGFAGGMNRGIAAAKTDYILLLNNDTVLEPTATEEMRKLLHGRDDVAGVAPKILLFEPDGFIDAIGNLIDFQGQAFNMGIGQLDIGQYDRVEETFGACFAATLMPRRAFAPGLVGPLDERFFMYYEDVDWCLRAGILGFKFLTCPTAVVRHAHSLTTRQLKYGYKYRLIMRNFVRTILKDFQGRRAYRAAARRSLGLARNVFRGPYRWASLMALKDITLGLPSFWRSRGPIQSRRKASDQSLFNFSHGEQGFFDPTGYQPIRALETLHAMYRRRYLLTGDENDLRIAETAITLAATRFRFNRALVLDKLRPLMAAEGPRAREYLESLQI